MKNDTSLRNNGTSEVLEEMRTFLSDPWKYLEEPLEQYRKAELLKNRKIYKDTQQQYQPHISSLIHTRNPQVIFSSLS